MPSRQDRSDKTVREMFLEQAAAYFEDLKITIETWIFYSDILSEILVNGAGSNRRSTGSMGVFPQLLEMP